MTLPVTNLDDRTFEQLSAEARALIPRYFRAWTDHNESDPGITLMELFAFMIEAMIYQINRVPERSLEHFAELVGVARETDPLTRQPERIELTLRRALESLETSSRAITEEEFERLAKQAGPDAGGKRVARANAIVETSSNPHTYPDTQVIKVVILPDDTNSPAPVPSGQLRQLVFEFLKARSPITTRIEVVSPQYTFVGIVAEIARDPASYLNKDFIRQSVENAIRNFLNPFFGGTEGKGWEFGRPVYRSELYQVIEGLPGVDHVYRLLLNGNEALGEVKLASSISLARLNEARSQVSVVEK